MTKLVTNFHGLFYIYLLCNLKIKSLRSMTITKYIYLTVLIVLLSFNNGSAQEEYIPPKLSNQESWTIIMLPDPQSYVKFERNQGIFELMTGWISENIDPLNIKLVLCTGDLVEQNEMIVPDNINGNQPSRNQWIAVSRAFDRLDGKVPYILAAGNHDYGYKSVEHRRSNYDKHFPAHKNSATEEIVREVGKNNEGVPTLENAAYEFISPHNRKFLFMNLEFAPRDTVLGWAKSVVAKEKYRDHTIAVLTHSYLNAENKHIVKEGYPITDGNYGKAVFDKLVEPSENIQLVFAGHIGASNDFKGHVGFKVDKNAAGKKVNQMVFNAQAMGGGWHGNGGDGWLRILEFMPDGKTVKVKTFSPLFAISPSTKKLAWSREDFNEFTFIID